MYLQCLVWALRWHSHTWGDFALCFGYALSIRMLSLNASLSDCDWACLAESLRSHKSKISLSSELFTCYSFSYVSLYNRFRLAWGELCDVLRKSTSLLVIQSQGSLCHWLLLRSTHRNLQFAGLHALLYRVFMPCFENSRVESLSLPS